MIAAVAWITAYAYVRLPGFERMTKQLGFHQVDVHFSSETRICQAPLQDIRYLGI